jgi:putative flippase GtrA
LTYTNTKIVIKHGFVSCICGGTELLTFSILNIYTTINIYLCYIISFSIATLIGYILHSTFTFSSGGLKKKSGYLFVIQVTIVLIVGLNVFNILHKYLGLSATFSKALQLCITFGVNVIFGKNITFKKESL